MNETKAPTVVGLVAELRAEIRRLHAENKRLREALEKALIYLDAVGVQRGALDALRAALAPEEEEPR